MPPRWDPCPRQADSGIHFSVVGGRQWVSGEVGAGVALPWAAQEEVGTWVQVSASPPWDLFGRSSIS